MIYYVYTLFTTKSFIGQLQVVGFKYLSHQCCSCGTVHIIKRKKKGEYQTASFGKYLLGGG